jgi:hypothetical protein
MLRFLLDEHISPVVAGELRQRDPRIPVASLHLWNEGALLGRPDSVILHAANHAKLTLVTYDQATIPKILLEWAYLGIPHSGVIFASQRSVPSNNFGLLIQALVRFWEDNHRQQWRDRVDHLKPPH